MLQAIYFRLKSRLVFFIMVAFFFVLIWPQLSDYSARAQTSEALSLISGARLTIFDFYKAHQRCPRSNIEVKNFTQQGKYVAEVSLAHMKDSDACYIVAKMANTGIVDRRVRGTKLMMVMEPLSLWDMQINCITDIKNLVADCHLRN